MSLAAIASLTACSSGPEGGVTLLGDSITKLAGPAVETRLEGTEKVRVVADWGYRIDEELESAADIGDRRPDQVIVNLGTNNVLQGTDLNTSIEDYRQLLRSLDDIACVHVITVNEHISLLGQDLSGAAVSFNTALRDLAGQFDNVTVTEWSTIFDLPADADLLDVDTIHPVEAGVERIAATYQLLVENCDVPEPD